MAVDDRHMPSQPDSLFQPLDGGPDRPDSAEMHLSVNRRTALVILGIATALGVFSALQAFNYVSFFSERDDQFSVLLALNLSYWYTWALLAPFMLWMARRFRFERDGWLRSVSAHVGGVLVATFTHAIVTVTARVYILHWMADREVEWWLVVRERFFLYFDWEMMTYWAVIAVAHALDYYRESQERAVTAAQLETRLAEAQLQALQRQLHPHFLFNTLHTISALMHRNIEAADAMLARLSDLLRLTLDQVGTQVVTLKEELDFVEKYLEIERTRFGDRLQVRIDAEAGTLDASVPNFILQPLVENALRHGIGPKLGGGTVEVTTQRIGDWLRLVVRDDGRGVPPEKLNAFNTGVGLGNTRSRLEHLYGSTHRFEFEAPPAGGLAVTIEVPFVVESEAIEDARSVA
jgi:two-component system LytT family sensor kinase